MIGWRPGVAGVCVALTGLAILSDQILSDRALVADELAKFTQHTGPVIALSASLDGSQVATASADGTSYVLDAQTLKPLQKFGPLGAGLTGVVLLKDRNVVVSAIRAPGNDYNLVRWSAATGYVTRRYKDSHMNLIGVQAAPDESYLAVVQQSPKPRLYGVNSAFHTELEVPATKPICQCVAFSPDSKQLVAASGGGFQRWSLQPEVRALGEIAAESDAKVMFVACLPDNKRFLSAHSDGDLRLWNLAEGALIHRRKSGSQTITSLAISPSGKFAACGHKEGFVSIVPIGSSDPVETYQSNGAILAIAYIAEDRLITASEDRTVRLMTLAGKPSRNVERPGYLPPPDAAELTQATTLIKQLFASDYASKRPADKRKLVEKLLKQSEANAVGATERYALRREALDIATALGDWKIAVDTARQLRLEFAMPDTFTLETFTALGDKVSLSKDEAELASLTLNHAKDASDAQNYPQAEQLGRLALKLATKSTSGALVKSVRDFAEELKRDRQAHEAYTQALITLERQPTAAAANTTAGTYLCFVKGDWKLGITHLALGSDGALKDLATRELSAPTDAAGKLALGESWHAAADAAPTIDRPHYLAAALYWYRRAQSQLTGLQKLKVDQAIAKIGKLRAERD